MLLAKWSPCCSHLHMKKHPHRAQITIYSPCVHDKESQHTLISVWQKRMVYTEAKLENKMDKLW